MQRNTDNASGRSQKEDMIKLHQMTEDIFSNLYEKVKESFLHLILIGYDVKKKTKKNKFLKLATVARRHLLIDLVSKGKVEDILTELFEFVF